MNNHEIGADLMDNSDSVSKEEYLKLRNLLEEFFDVAVEMDWGFCKLLAYPNEPSMQMSGTKYDKCMDAYEKVGKYLKQNKNL